MLWLMLMAPGGQGGQGGGSTGFLSTLIMMVMIFGIFYFLIIRPQRRAQKARESMLSALKKGDEVVTSGGVYGTVVGMKNDSVILKVDDATKVRVQRAAITGIVKEEQ